RQLDAVLLGGQACGADARDLAVEDDAGQPVDGEQPTAAVARYEHGHIREKYAVRRCRWCRTRQRPAALATRARSLISQSIVCASRSSRQRAEACHRRPAVSMWTLASPNARCSGPDVKRTL